MGALQQGRGDLILPLAALPVVAVVLGTETRREDRVPGEGTHQSRGGGGNGRQGGRCRFCRRHCHDAVGDGVAIGDKREGTIGKPGQRIGRFEDIGDRRQRYQHEEE